MTCTDLCTAAKCQELEQRIVDLESKYTTLLDAILTLKTNFEFHEQNNIYDAHNYQPTIEFDVSEYEGTLYFYLDIDEYSAFSDVQMPGINLDNLEIIFESKEIIGEYDLIISDPITFSQASGFLKVDYPEVKLELEHFYYDNTIELYLIGKEYTSNVYSEIIIELDELQIEEEEEQYSLDVSLNYAGGFLEVVVTYGNSSDFDTVEIDAEIINNYYGGGNDDVSCQQIEQQIDDCCIQILTAIGGVSSQLTNAETLLSSENTEIKNELTIDVSGQTVTEFVCEDEDEQTVTSTALNYSGKGIDGIHQLLKTTNQNLQTIFEAICLKDPVIAAPSWWQVRLGGNVPQICCTFRRVGTRTYHSLTIPHPINTEIPTQPLLNEYTKGNIQAMIVCTDNSKFIVNANSVEEAERVANEARSLIDPNYLPNPFKVWIGERKGEPVAEDLMKPTSVFYYSTGQQNSKPDWRVGLSNMSTN